MSWWQRFTERKATEPGSWSVFRDWLAQARGTKSGAQVSWSTALEVATVLACAKVIADGIAQVPFKVFQESNGSRLPARQHALYRLLHRRPNPWQTSFSYRQTIGLHLVLCGNHYSFKNRVRGQVVELLPFAPNTVRPHLAADGVELLYDVLMSDGRRITLTSADVWHIRGASWNGWQGLEAVKLAREAIGLAMTTENEHARLFQNGVRSSGEYSVTGTLTKEQHGLLRQFIADNYAGDKNAGLPMVLDRDAKWNPRSLTGVDAQHLETRRYQAQEICRALRVMPIMVGLDDKGSTYASAEQMFMAHAVHTLGPWYECIEQSADVDLLTEEDEAAGYYCKFVVQGLMRGSMKDRAEYLAKALGAGGAPAWMTQDEARGAEEMNPMGGAAAKLPPRLGTPAKTATEPTPDDPSEEPQGA